LRVTADVTMVDKKYACISIKTFGLPYLSRTNGDLIYLTSS